MILPESANALQLVRLLTCGEIRYYAPVTFYRVGACNRVLARSLAVGFVSAEPNSTYGQFDVLDIAGNIIADFPLTKSGFRYWQRKFRVKVC